MENGRLELVVYIYLGEMVTKPRSAISVNKTNLNN